MGRDSSLGGFWKPDEQTKQAYRDAWVSRKKRRAGKSKRARKNTRNGLSPKRVAKLCRLPGEIFYNTDEWRILRFRVLDTYGRRCMKCGMADGEIHVDHIKPRSKYPELSMEFSNLQVLCRDCNVDKSNHYSEDYRDKAAAEELDMALLTDARVVGL